MGPQYRTPEQRRDDWMREMLYRQRNIVYPETAFNGARFWRHLSSRKYPFTRGQKICFAGYLLIFTPSLLAVFLQAIVSLVTSRASFMDWIVDIPQLGLVLLIGVLMIRGFGAVFGDAPSLPELPLSARQNMIDTETARIHGRYGRSRRNL